MKKKIILLFLLFNSLLIYHYFFLSEYAFASEYYVDPKNGNDTNNGSLSNSWNTLKNSIPKLKSGDTLYLRGGTYFESGVVINIKGTESNPIIIKNYPGEAPTIDGGYKEFREIPNADWELYDSAKKIYRSVKTYPSAKYVYGYFGPDNDNYRLVPYEDNGHLSSDNEYFTGDGYTYVGPGVFWNSSDEKIYIRLKHSKQQISMGYSIPSNLDPRQIKMYIFPHHEIIIFGKESAFLNIEGINFIYQNNALEYLSGSHHISVKNSNILGGRTHILVRKGVHDLILDNIRIEDSIPPWVAWIDIKWGMKPAHRFQGPAIELHNSTYNIEIMNSTFKNTWDGIDALNSPYKIHIHHNEFSGTRDDVIQLGSASYDIEINNNKMLFVSKGVSRNGSGSPIKPGTKYIHHNIVDCSKPMLGGRKDLNDMFPGKMAGPNNDGLVWAAPFGGHSGSGYGKGDPWKIYNNTIIFGKELNNKGAGHTYTIKSFYSGKSQEVYNNIFIQISDHWLSRRARVADGSQIFDGNLYFKSISNPKKYLFFRFWDGNNLNNNKSFRTLSDFKASQFFTDTKSYYTPGWENSGIEADPQLDSDYRPDPNGPAASGAVLLPSHWPGQDVRKYRGALPPVSPADRPPKTPKFLEIIQ